VFQVNPIIVGGKHADVPTYDATNI